MLIESATRYINTNHIEQIECYTNDELKLKGLVAINLYMVSGDVIHLVKTEKYYNQLLDLLSE